MGLLPAVIPLPYRLGAIALLCVGCGAVGYHTHDVTVYQPHLAKDREALLKATRAVQHLEQATNAVATQARDTHDTNQEMIHATTQNIIKFVPVYVPQVQAPDVGSRVDGVGGVPPVPSVTVGFGRLYDYGILGVDPPVPTPTSEPLDQPSGITMPELAETLAGNSGVCHQWGEEVRAWRAWYPEEKALWDKAAGR